MRKTIFAACLLLACGTAWAQFDDWDIDNDGYLDSDEFYESTFDAFDEDDDVWNNHEFETASEEDWFEL